MSQNASSMGIRICTSCLLQLHVAMARRPGCKGSRSFILIATALRIVKNSSCCMDQKIAPTVTRKTLQREGMVWDCNENNCWDGLVGKRGRDSFWLPEGASCSTPRTGLGGSKGLIILLWPWIFACEDTLYPRWELDVWLSRYRLLCPAGLSFGQGSHVGCIRYQVIKSSSKACSSLRGLGESKNPLEQGGPPLCGPAGDRHRCDAHRLPISTCRLCGNHEF